MVENKNPMKYWSKMKKNQEFLAGRKHFHHCLDIKVHTLGNHLPGSKTYIINQSIFGRFYNMHYYIFVSENIKRNCACT